MFYEKLKENREKLGISQEELASRLDISKQTVQKWESGISMPDLENIIKLSEIFNVSIDYLLKDRKAETDFSYYTVVKADKKTLSKHKIISLSIFTLAMLSSLTLLAISLVEPIIYLNVENGTEYRGFMAYYFTFSEFKTVAIFTLIVLISSSIALFVQEDKLFKLFHKKN